MMEVVSWGVSWFHAVSRLSAVVAGRLSWLKKSVDWARVRIPEDFGNLVVEEVCKVVGEFL